MTLARFQSHAVDDTGNVLAGAQVTVRHELPGATLASLFTDREGVTPTGNPVTADVDGYFFFHVIGGAYRIDAVLGASSRTWRYVGIGRAAETDGRGAGVPFGFDIGTTDADPGLGQLRLNNATLASVTRLFISEASLEGADVSAWLASWDDGGSSADRGTVTIQTGTGAFLLARVTGSVVDDGGYRDITVTVLASGGSFADEEPIYVTFSTNGANGDVVGPGAATIGQLAIFGDTLGATIEGAETSDSPPAPLLATDLLVGDPATDAEIRAATPGAKFIAAQDLETASAYVALTDAAPVAVDWDAGINFSLTVTASRQIGNPTNGQPGTDRAILVQGNDTTDRTITFGNQYLGEVPVIIDCDSGRWYEIYIRCHTASHFSVSAKRVLGT